MKKLNFDFLCKNPNGTISKDMEGNQVNISKELSGYLMHASFKASDAVTKFTLAQKILKEFESNDAEFDLIKKLLDSRLLAPMVEANAKIYLNNLKF